MTMKMRWGWYMTWADDPCETEWRGTCPQWAQSMRDSALRTGRKLIIRRVKFLMPTRYFCIECQTTH